LQLATLQKYAIPLLFAIALSIIHQYHSPQFLTIVSAARFTHILQVAATAKNHTTINSTQYHLHRSV
jgi:hypothetical protein